MPSTIVPLRIYIKNHKAKVQIGLAKGRRQYDKRRVIIEREREREARKALARASTRFRACDADEGPGLSSELLLV